MSAPVLKVSGLKKAYGAIQAVGGVSFEVMPDEIFVVIEHNMDFVMDLCHRIMVMVEGQVLAIGTPEQIRGNKQVLDAYLGS